MTDRAAFIAAICERPDDDAPRLVFADWLEEHGEPERAEFIRVQCRLAEWGCTFKQTKEQPGWKHNCGTDDNGYWLCQPLRSRADRLLEEPRHFVNWVPSLLHTGSGAGIHCGIDGTVELTGKGFQSVEFSRGFIDSITCTAADWLAHHAALTWHPEHCPHECPETAQPLRVVRLTDDGLVVSVRGRGQKRIWNFENDPSEWQSEPDDWQPVFLPTRREQINAVLSHVCQLRWPWLTVELPAEPNAHPYERGEDMGPLPELPAERSARESAWVLD